MTQDRRITDKLPGQPLQWDDSASPAAAPAAGQAGLAKLEGWRAWLPEHVAGWQDGFGVHRSDIEPEIIIVTVERKQIQLYENEFAFLLDKMLGFVGCDERAAPVAADTEQATIDTPEFRALMIQFYTGKTRNRKIVSYEDIVAFIDSVKLTPLATPADAGAGEALTDEDLTAIYNECAIKADDWSERQAREPSNIEAKGYFMRLLLARMSTPGAQVTASQPELTVWEGPMPESNGKQNYAAILTRKNAQGFDVFTDGICFQRSEYPDRVRYEADCMRYLIGERAEKPEMWDKGYDFNKHSGYVKAEVGQYSAPVTAEPVAELEELLSRLTYARTNEAPGGAEEAKAAIRAFIAATPAPADRDAIRDQALEEAAKACEGEAIKQSVIHCMRTSEVAHSDSAHFCAERIRALKTQPSASHTATDEQKGGAA